MHQVGNGLRPRLRQPAAFRDPAQPERPRPLLLHDQDPPRHASGYRGSGTARRALARPNKRGASKIRLLPDEEGVAVQARTDSRSGRALPGFDLDVAITGPLDPLPAIVSGKVIMRHDWINAQYGIEEGHGSAFRFDPRLHGWIYETLVAGPTGEAERFEGMSGCMFHRRRRSAARSPTILPTAWRRSGAISGKAPKSAFSFNPDCRKTPATSASMADRTITRRWRDAARPGRPWREETGDVSGRGSAGSTGLRRILAPTGRERGGKKKARRAERKDMTSRRAEVSRPSK